MNGIIGDKEVRWTGCFERLRFRAKVGKRELLSTHQVMPTSKHGEEPRTYRYGGPVWRVRMRRGGIDAGQSRGGNAFVPDRVCVERIERRSSEEPPGYWRGTP